MSKGIRIVSHTKSETRRGNEWIPAIKAGHVTPVNYVILDRTSGGTVIWSLIFEIPTRSSGQALGMVQWRRNWSGLGSHTTLIARRSSALDVAQTSSLDVVNGASFGRKNIGDSVGTNLEANWYDVNKREPPEAEGHLALSRPCCQK